MRIALAVVLAIALASRDLAATPPLDGATAVVTTTGAAETEMARRARQVGRSAADTVFGAVAPAPRQNPHDAPGEARAVREHAAPAPDDGLDDWPEGEARAEGAVPLGEPGRDPFRPFTLDLRAETRDEAIASPLQRYELSQLRLAGVVVDVLPPRAMLQDNSGMGFIVTPGTPIGRRHGVVKSIEPRRVVVEEVALDDCGRQRLHQVVIDMPNDDAPEGVSQKRP
jgi:hypothetical protein